MKKKDALGFVLMLLGVIALFGGVRLASGGDVRGWAAIGSAIALLLLAFRAMRSKRSSA